MSLNLLQYSATTRFFRLSFLRDRGSCSYDAYLLPRLGTRCQRVMPESRNKIMVLFLIRRGDALG